MCVLLATQLPLTHVSLPFHTLQRLARLLLSLARLRYAVPQHQAAHLLAPHPPQAFSAHDLGAVLKALAVMRCVPGTEWIMELLASTEDQLQRWPPQVGVCLVYHAMTWQCCISAAVGRLQLSGGRQVLCCDCRCVAVQMLHS